MSYKGSRFFRPKSRFMPVVPLSSKSFIRNKFRDPRFSSLDDDVLYTPYRPSTTFVDTYPDEAYSHSQVNRELYLSTAAMEDSYDIMNRSRNRDRDVLAAANQAINPPPVTSGVSESTRRTPLRRSHSTPRSLSVPPKRPTPAPLPAITLPTSGLIASQPSAKNSPYLNYVKNALGNDTYEPIYSKMVRTPVSPMRELSPYRLRSISPYGSPPRSGTQSPIGASRKRHKPRVLASKRRVGNYYNRLLAKRSGDRTGKEGKYWPYIDVEDIEYENVGDLLSDCESPERDYGSSGNTYYVQPLGAYDGDITPTTYSYDTYDDSDIPEYVPYRPKIRGISPERDYSSASVLPYLPRREPGKSSVADDIAFNAIVAASAARARRALDSIKWSNYDQASLVLSVEGEYHPPEETPVAFRYISRPLPLKMPATQTVSVQDSDDSFTKYLTDLKTFREGVRKRLEDGYRALSTESTAYYKPAITYSSHKPTDITSRPISKPYRSRLGERTDYKYGHSLELYPLSSRRSGPLALPSSSDAVPESRALKLYDSKYDPESKLSTFAKVQIKVDTELHSTPRAAVASRRVLRGRSVPPTPVAAVHRVSASEVDLGFARASPYILRYPLPPASNVKTEGRYPRVIVVPRFRHTVPLKASRIAYVKPAREPSPDFDTEGLRRAPLSLLAYLRNLDNKLNSKRYVHRISYAPYRAASKKAALLGSKVDVVTPERRRRPRSVYGQASLKKVEAKAEQAKSESPQPAAAPTVSLHAHRPVYTPPTKQTPIIPQEEVVERPNVLAWKYRVDAYTPPDDVVFMPRSLDSVRGSVLEAKEKVYRHKQLMDRVLWEPGLSAADRKVLMSVQSRAPRALPASLNEIKPSERMRRKRQRLLQKHRLEY